MAWFQGRSECGPRALGNRSILARPDRENLKDYLNQHIKFRESFRPYGCSVLEEDSALYFAHSPEFRSPFMSFAVPVREEHRQLLRHVTHIDGTSRMQTVSAAALPRFAQLLQAVKKRTGHGVLLNTSLNVMNEPILETVADARRFWESSRVDAMVIGDILCIR